MAKTTRRTTGKKPRNRAAQDATLVNVRALKRTVAELKQQVDAWATWCHATGERLLDLESHFPHVRERQR